MKKYNSALEEAIQERLGKICLFPRGGFFSMEGTRKFLMQVQQYMPERGRFLDFGCGVPPPWKSMFEAYGVRWYGADVLDQSTPIPRYRKITSNKLDYEDGFF